LIIQHQKKNMLASLGKAFGLTGGVLPVTPLYQANCRKRGFVERRNESRLPKQYPTPTKSIFVNIKTKKEISERPFSRIKSLLFNKDYPLFILKMKIVLKLSLPIK
jgi:hypothetical protein